MRHADRFSLFIAVLVMALAVWALPYPGNLMLLGCAAVGAAIAVWRLRSRAQ